MQDDNIYTNGFFESHYQQSDKWEKAWLNNETDWWPDSIHLKDEQEIIRSGCPSSGMPAKAQEVIQKLIDNNERYVTHVATGIHAYRIGFAREYNIKQK